jgi:hypothetical protein
MPISGFHNIPVENKEDYKDINTDTEMEPETQEETQMQTEEGEEAQMEEETE